mgnify:CR=1 FL=1
MHYGDVVPFANTKNDKEQALKPLEEAAEVFGAWQRLRTECHDDCNECIHRCINHALFVGECADVVQAVTNLLDAAGVSYMGYAMDDCRQRNAEKGRKYAW